MNGSRRSVEMRMSAARGLLVALLLPAVLPTTTWGQQPQDNGRKLRQIAVRKLPANTPVIGLEYTVVHIDANGVRKPVDVPPETYPFNIGDSFLVRIKPQDDLFVYVFTEGPNGNRSRLLPEDPTKPLRVKANTEIDIPDDAENLFTFEAPAGEEKLIVVAMKEHSPQKMDVLLQQAFESPGQKLNSRKTRGGKRQQVDRVGDISPGADAQLESTPDQSTPQGEVIGVNRTELVVGISLNSRPRGQQAK